MQPRSLYSLCKVYADQRSRRAVCGYPSAYTVIMQRTTITLPDELLARVRRIADEQGNSVAAVIRDALEEKVRDYRPRPRSLGIGASGYSDTARRAGEERPVPR